MRFVPVLVVLGLSTASAQAAVMTATAVDTFDPSGAGTINQPVLSNEAGLAVSTWQSRLSTAFAGGSGGVWNGAALVGTTNYLDTDTGYNNGLGTPVQITVASGKVVSLTASGTNGANELATLRFSSATPVSGTRLIGSALGSNGVDPAWTMNLASSGFDPGSLITEVGFAQIGRTAGNSTTFTATLTDNSTLVLTGANLANASNRLVHFKAPAGLGIASISMVNSNTSGEVLLDDLGFIVTPPTVIPEPNTVLGAMALSGLVLRRRR